MTLLSLAMIVYATSYWFKPLKGHFAGHPRLLMLHIAGGTGALLAGPWQFVGALRARWLTLHRWLGRFYLLEVGLASVAGFGLAIFSQEGMPTHLGFGVLAVLWFGSGLQAYRMARARNIRSHRRWMIRNYALTMAAPMLRVWLVLLLGKLHEPFSTSFIIVSWLCWVPNLFVAEWIVRYRTRLVESAVAL